MEQFKAPEKDCNSCVKINELEAEIESLKQEKAELNKALKQLNILYQSTRTKYVEIMEIHEQLEESYYTVIDENTALKTENQTLKNKQATNIFARIFDILFGKGAGDE